VKRDIVAVAHAIAERAHEGQVDKLGVDYIEHPRWVASRVDTPLRKAAALLHDVIEDTGLTEDDLIRLGIPLQVVWVVALLTRRVGICPEEYYAAIRQDEDALAVKLADIEHNTHPSRTALLTEKDRTRLNKKYAKARQCLLESAATAIP
jgi:(p)ppGpp synthase/HD superfamily hydrolase